MTSLGRRQAVSQRLLVPSFHRFESCRPRKIKEFSDDFRELLFFLTLRILRGVDRIRTGANGTQNCEQWRSNFGYPATGGGRKWAEAAAQGANRRFATEAANPVYGNCRDFYFPRSHRRGESCWLWAGEAPKASRPPRKIENEHELKRIIFI